MPRSRSGYFGKQMEDPEYAAEYERERQRIDAIDSIIRELDAERERQGLSKAELARLTDKRAELVRRLFSADEQNPTLATVIDIARSLGLEVTVQPSGRANVS
jgi:DNA-binding phage protein